MSTPPQCHGRRWNPVRGVLTLVLTLAGTLLAPVPAATALPGQSASAPAVRWVPSDPEAVSASGHGTRPTPERPPTETTKETVRESGAAGGPDLTDREKATRAAEALVVPDADDVRGNLTLPTSGAYDTRVTWKSTRKHVVTPTGEVTRPEPGRKAVAVTLTATVHSGKATVKRRFHLTVPPLPEREPYEGYAFTYFTGEGLPDGEQVYFAASRGNDPLRWDELAGGEPVLRSHEGELGVRDPFLIRSPEGDTFYLIATDLKMYGDGDWDRAQRHGSKHIEVWESHDLVHWSPQRHVRVAPDTAGNVWAPEAYYDHSIGAYVVFWASKLYSEDDPDHTGDTHNRMMYATTRDFRTFSEPRVWVDPGHSVIDSTIIEHGGYFHRFTKDERSNTADAPCGKFIVAERSRELRDLDYEFVAECIGKGDDEHPGISRGEGPTVFKSNTEDRWYLFIDEFGGRGYVPFETTDLDSGEWRMSTNYELPGRPRHGTVLPVTQRELDRLRAAYGD